MDAEGLGDALRHAEYYMPKDGLSLNRCCCPICLNTFYPHLQFLGHCFFNHHIL